MGWPSAGSYLPLMVFCVGIKVQDRCQQQFSSSILLGLKPLEGRLSFLPNSLSHNLQPCLLKRVFVAGHRLQSDQRFLTETMWGCEGTERYHSIKEGPALLVGRTSYMIMLAFHPLETSLSAWLTGSSKLNLSWAKRCKLLAQSRGAKHLLYAVGEMGFVSKDLTSAHRCKQHIDEGDAQRRDPTTVLYVLQSHREKLDARISAALQAYSPEGRRGMNDHDLVHSGVS